MSEIATNDARELTGRVAVVTGASSGIGRAIALELAAAGADVLVHYRRNQAGAAEVTSAIEALGRRAKSLSADIADSSSHAWLVSEAWKWQSGVQIWVNNAGADVLTGKGARLSYEEKLDELWKVDVQGTLLLSRDVGKRMQESAGGAILNIGWDQAEFGMAGESGEMFAATKGAIMAFTRSLAKSLAPQVRVNALAPGWIRTAWGEGASQAWQDRARRESVLGRWGTPEDVARAARFLVSPRSAFITGQVLPVNGGLNFAHTQTNG